MDDKVFVTSMITGQTSINMPDLRVKKIWPKKGTKLPISKEFLREAIYDPGVEYMFKTGMLAIEDMDFKIELGLEEEGTKEPTNVLTMDEKYMLRILKNMPLNEMAAEIGKMSSIQKDEFIEYASNQNDVSLDRLETINKACNVDLWKIIELKKQKEA